MSVELSRTIVKFLPPEDVGEDQSGWWILCMEPRDDGDMGPDGEGYSWDAIGPYDSKEEANRNLEGNASL
jgi:hypothetical protein